MTAYSTCLEHTVSTSPLISIRQRECRSVNDLHHTQRLFYDVVMKWRLIARANEIFMNKYSNRMSVQVTVTSAIRETSYTIMHMYPVFVVLIVG